MIGRRSIFHFVFFRPAFFRLGSRLLHFLRHAEARSLTYRFKACGEGVDLYSPIYISSPENLTVGDRVAFASFVHIWAEGGVRIGNRVMVGSHSAITSLTHDYTAESMQDSLVKQQVTIEDDVWIGTHSVVMPGVTIGRGAVIGAGTVVTKDVAPYSIVVGVPGELMRMREVSLQAAAERLRSGRAAAA